MKVIWKLAILGTATLAIVAANSIREPVPFPFLEQYEVLDSRVSGPYRILTLRANSATVLEEARKHINESSLWNETEAPNWCGFGKDSRNPLHIANDISRLNDDQPHLIEKGICFVQFKRQKSPMEQAWLWLQTKTGNAPKIVFRVRN